VPVAGFNSRRANINAREISRGFSASGTIINLPIIFLIQKSNVFLFENYTLFNQFSHLLLPISICSSTCPAFILCIKTKIIKAKNIK
jgi:hypothetical protein